MSAAEISEARRVGEQALQQSNGLDELADTLSKLVSDLGDPVFERVGLDARRRTERVGTFSSFLRYLAAAAEFDPAKIWMNATAINSTTPHNGLNSLSAGERAG